MPTHRDWGGEFTGGLLCPSVALFRPRNTLRGTTHLRPGSPEAPHRHKPLLLVQGRWVLLPGSVAAQEW